MEGSRNSVQQFVCFGPINYTCSRLIIPTCFKINQSYISCRQSFVIFPPLKSMRGLTNHVWLTNQIWWCGYIVRHGEIQSITQKHNQLSRLKMTLCGLKDLTN